jgi:hypothetical protein
MKITWKAYSILGIIMILSALSVWFFPISDFYKGMYALPGVASLAGALLQLSRDQAAYEKDQEMQRKQHFFNLSVTSHMAQVAFDKHVLFCEAYIKEVRNIVDALYSQGVTRSSAENHPLKLRRIRSEYESWISMEITIKLAQFERDLKQMSTYGDYAKEETDKEKKKMWLMKAHEFYGIVIGDVEDDSSPDKVIEHLQDILGIKELTALRQAVIREAIKTI